jgi:SagB-type dehydrogenase family enzyme
MMSRSIWPILAAIAISQPASGQPAAPSDRKLLPSPRTDGGPSLTAALATRRSIRTFGRRELRDDELGQLLWAAQGVIEGHRTAPSAGALYPLVIRLVDTRGVWRYVPAQHALVRELATPARGALASWAGAPVVFVVSAKVAITARKYGDRAERYATLEAGHAAQNLLLEATALGLAGFPIGAFDDSAVRRAAGLGSDETPLYLIPVGARR